MISNETLSVSRPWEIFVLNSLNGGGDGMNRSPLFLASVWSDLSVGSSSMARVGSRWTSLNAIARSSFRSDQTVGSQHDTQRPWWCTCLFVQWVQGRTSDLIIVCHAAGPVAKCEGKGATWLISLVAFFFTWWCCYFLVFEHGVALGFNCLHCHWGPCHVGFLSKKDAHIHCAELCGDCHHIKQVCIDCA